MERMTERVPMWERIGTSSEDHSFDALFNKAGLNYKVEVRDLLTSNGVEVRKVPDRFATVRSDTGDVLGIVSDRYKVCQNEDALDFVKFIDGVDLIRAGIYNGGSGCYMIGKLPEVTVLGDKIRPNIIWQNTHDGSGSIRSTVCMLRLVCQNQFVQSFKNSPVTIKFSHMGDLNEKLLAAKQQLVSVYDYISVYEEEATKYARSKITPEKFNKILQSMFNIKEDNSPRLNQRLETEKSMFITAYEQEDNQNFKGTKWGVINAFSDFITHGAPSRKSENWDENRFLWSLNPSIMDNFVELIEAA